MTKAIFPPGIPDKATQFLESTEGFPTGFPSRLTVHHYLFRTEIRLLGLSYRQVHRYRTGPSSDPGTLQPQGSAAAIMVGLITPFIWAGIIALIISIILAFLMARSVYHPIHGCPGRLRILHRGIMTKWCR
jgi:hypothetical protein